MAAPEKNSKLTNVRVILQDPEWWLRDIFTALLVGLIVATGTILGQNSIDDRRATREDVAHAAEVLRENEINAAERRHLEQLEDLRFVREGSSNDPARPRKFSTLDLAGQDLVGLHLVGADFAYTDFSGARLIATNFSNSDFTRAHLNNANLSRANLSGAYFGVNRFIDEPNQPGADLTGANLVGADLTGADLSHADLDGAQLATANLTDVLYNAATKWPNGFAPPPSRADH